MRELRYRNFRLLIGSIIFSVIGLFFLMGALTAVIEKEFGLFYGLLPVSLILLFISILVGHKAIGMEKKRSKQIKKGECFEAQIIDVSHDKSIRVKRVAGNISWYPLVITIRYIDENGVPHIEKSKRLYYRLSEDLNKFSSKVWVSAGNRKDVYIQVFYHENK